MKYICICIPENFQMKLKLNLLRLAIVLHLLKHVETNPVVYEQMYWRNRRKSVKKYVTGFHTGCYGEGKKFVGHWHSIMHEYETIKILQVFWERKLRLGGKGGIPGPPLYETSPHTHTYSYIISPLHHSRPPLVQWRHSQRKSGGSQWNT